MALVVMLLCARAGAATIEWRAPRGCPDARDVRGRIERRLERSLDDIAVTVEIDVARSRGTYTARVDLGALTVANDVRTLRSARCSELADAVAVIVARVASDIIARDELAAIDVHPIAPAAPARPPAPSPVSQRDDGESPDPVDPDDPARRRWTIGARVSGVSGIGLIPQVGLGGELAISVRGHSHLAELGTARWVASAAQFYNGAPVQADIDLDVTVARYGWRPAVMPLRAWLAVEVGTMTGHGVRLPTEDPARARWVAAGAGFGIAWPMTRWSRLVGTTEALFAIERARFATDGMVVYAPAPMSVRFGCGLEVGWQ